MNTQLYINHKWVMLSSGMVWTPLHSFALWPYMLYNHISWPDLEIFPPPPSFFCFPSSSLAPSSTLHQQPRWPLISSQGCDQTVMDDVCRRLAGADPVRWISTLLFRARKINLCDSREAECDIRISGSQHVSHWVLCDRCSLEYNGLNFEVLQTLSSSRHTLEDSHVQPPTCLNIPHSHPTHSQIGVGC